MGLTKMHVSILCVYSFYIFEAMDSKAESLSQSPARNTVLRETALQQLNTETMKKQLKSMYQEEEKITAARSK